MVGDSYGFVVENDDASLEAQLEKLLLHPDIVRTKKMEMTALASCAGSMPAEKTNVMESLIDQ